MGMPRILTFIAVTATFSGVVALVACAPGGDSSETRITRTNGKNPQVNTNNANLVPIPVTTAPVSMNRQSHDYILESVLRGLQQTGLEVKAMTQEELDRPEIKTIEADNSEVSLTGAIDQNGSLFTDSVARSFDKKMTEIRAKVLTGDDAQKLRNLELARKVRSGKVEITTEKEKNERSVKVVLGLRLTDAKTDFLTAQGVLATDGSAQIETTVNNQKFIVLVNCDRSDVCDNAVVTLQKSEPQFSQAIMIRRVLSLLPEVEVSTVAQAGQKASEKFTQLAKAFQDWKQGIKTNHIRRVRIESLSVALGISTLAISIDSSTAAQTIDPKDDKPATPGMSLKAPDQVAPQLPEGLDAINEAVLAIRTTLVGSLVRSGSGDNMNVDYEIHRGATSSISQLIESVKLVKNEGKGAFTLEVRAPESTAQESVKLSLRQRSTEEQNQLRTQIQAYHEQITRLKQAPAPGAPAAQRQSPPAAPAPLGRDMRRGGRLDVPQQPR